VLGQEVHRLGHTVPEQRLPCRHHLGMPGPALLLEETAGSTIRSPLLAGDSA
jgi:hypothetical protein